MISVGTITVLGYQLFLSAPAGRPFVPMTYRIAIGVFLGINTHVCGTIRGHRLVSVLSKMKNLLILVPMHTLHHFRPDKRTFGDNAFQRNHFIQMSRTKRSGIARQLAKATGICAIVYLVTL